MQNKELNEDHHFWYDSNAAWGWVKNFEDLYEMFEKEQESDFGLFKTINGFLNKSYQKDSGELSFGTRIEHNRDFTLKNYLEILGLLDDFLYFCKQQTNK